MHNLLPRDNRKRARQIFDKIVQVFYSDGYADKVCDIAHGMLTTEFTEPKLTAIMNSCVLETTR